MESTNQPVPVLRRIAAVLVGLEALVVAVSSLLVGGGAFSADAVADVGIAVALIGLLIAVPLGFACRALWRGKTWPRGLVLTWQVLQVVAGATIIEIWLVPGVLTIAVALAVGALVIADARPSPSPDEV